MIGERLIELRKDKGLTQKQLAEKLFLNFRTYSGYERDETEASDEVKIKIAQFYNVSIDYLLGVSENPAPINKGNDYIRLPKALSADGRKELDQYIKYLLSKDGKQ